MNEGEERSLQRKATTAERRRERLPFPVQPARRLLIANNLITRVADRQRCQKRKRLVIPPAAIPLPRGSADGYPKSRARFPRPSRGGEHTTTESKAGNCCPQRDSCQPSTAPRKKELFCLPRPAAQGRYVPSPTKQGDPRLRYQGCPRRHASSLGSWRGQTARSNQPVTVRHRLQRSLRRRKRGRRSRSRRTSKPAGRRRDHHAQKPTGAALSPRQAP